MVDECPLCDTQDIGDNPDCFLCVEAIRVQGLDFCAILGNDDWYFWAHEMPNPYRFYDWHRPLTMKNFTSKGVQCVTFTRWDKEAEVFAYELERKYGMHINDPSRYLTGPGSYMRRRCERAQKKQEKMSYYWGSKEHKSLCLCCEQPIGTLCGYCIFVYEN